MFLVRALLVVVAAAGLAQPVEAEVRRLILAAGANNGGVDRELLRYAVSDAEQFVEVLQEMGGLDPADVLLLRDPDLTAFKQGLADLGRRVKAASRREDRLEVLLYYSGHADEEGLLLAGDHLGYQQLLDSLKTANAAVRMGPWKLLQSSGGLIRLYNVAQDPSESKDLSDQEPERVSQLREALTEWSDGKVGPREGRRRVKTKFNGDLFEWHI